jgi:uncharacterized protein
MRIDLTEIARTPGMHATQVVEETDLGGWEVACIVPVRGLVSFTNTGSLLILKGEVHTEVRLECGRCLREFEFSVTAEIQEEYRLERIGDAVRVYPLDEDDAFRKLVQNNVLDFHELIRQSLLVALPIQPLCKPDCEGLCPTCGQNLNLGKCKCLPARTGSPFDVLAKLIEEDSNDLLED